MKKIKNILVNACVYTVVLLAVFFLFIAIDSGANSAITLSSFASIFCIGCIVSLSNLLFAIKKLRYPLRVTVHFFALLASLFALLMATGFLAGKTASSYIVLVFAYAIVYAIVFATCHIIRRGTMAMSKRHPEKKNEQAENNKNKKTEYKPLYK